jgi:hypothetical protein
VVVDVALLTAPSYQFHVKYLVSFGPKNQEPLAPVACEDDSIPIYPVPVGFAVIYNQVSMVNVVVFVAKGEFVVVSK